MMGKFYKNIIFPGQQWYLRDSLLEDGRKTFTFNTFLHSNIKRYLTHVLHSFSGDQQVLPDLLAMYYTLLQKKRKMDSLIFPGAQDPDPVTLGHVYF